MSRLVVLLFVIVLGMDIGAGLYESRVVVPLWSRDVPGTLAAGDPYGRVAVAAGMRFWAFVTPAVGLLAVVSLGFGLVAPQPRLTWQVAASAIELCAFTMTMLYFKPTLMRLFLGHGTGMSNAAVVATVRRWIVWNWVRVGLSLVAWGAALRALTLR
jgi:hypothetical protein